MTQQRTFTLIGSFTDNITPAIGELNRTIASISTTKRGGFSDLTKSIGKVNAAQKHMRDSIKQTVSSLNDYHTALSRVYRGLEAYSKQLGKLRGAQIQMDRSAKQIKDQAAAWDQANTALERYLRNQRQVGRGFGGGPGGPPRGPGGGGGGGRGGGGGGRGRQGPLQFAQDFLITNAIVSGFYKGVQIMQNGLNSVFGAFAERTKDQLEDIASAGGIFSAGKFGGAKGLPTTFQGALEMQDNINKSMAAVASALPGTTQDFVMNARRMTDTLAQMMSKNTQEFEKLAQKLSGNTQARGEKAFEIINVEVAKATTLLEKLNPTRTTVPMTQIVEDMMKSQTVSIAGLRRYVSFRRATTFEASMSRNLKELNAAGAGTAQRLGAIIKTLKEAVPPELITAMTTSVSGVIEGFKSAILDPDVGIFGLSRTLSRRVLKFNKETGEIMKDELGNAMTDTTNFFKSFADIFGNFGNLLNSVILPGIMALYNPFEQMGLSLEKLREYSFMIFKYQQGFTTYYSKLAEKYGMSTGSFKSGEKGGLAVILKLLRGYNILSANEVKEYEKIMAAQGSDEQIEFRMKKIYEKVIPAFLNSPFISKIFEAIGFTLGKAAGVLSEVLGAIAGVNTPSASAFTKAFTEAGGVEALRKSFDSVIIILTKVIVKVLSAITTAFVESLVGKNQGNLIDRARNVLFLLLPTLLIPGVRNFVVAVIKGIFSGLSSRAVVQGAASAAQGAASSSRITGDVISGGGRVGGGASTFWTTSAMQRARGRLPARMRLARMAARRNVLSSPIAPMARSVRAAGGGVTGVLGRGAAALGRSGVGRGVGSIARFVPKGAIVGGAIDMGIALASGENFGKAAASTIGSVIGGTLGSALGPVGTIIGSMAGGMIADAGFDLITGASEQGKAAAVQLEAAQKQLNAATDAAIGDWGGEYGTRLGGVRALSDALGGGAGIKNYAQEQLKLGNILPEQAAQWANLGTQLSSVNAITDKVKKAQLDYQIASQSNTGKQEYYRKRLDTAQAEQRAALSKITSGWESMSSSSREKILQGVDEIKAALVEGAGRLRNYRPPNPSPPNVIPERSTPSSRLRKPARVQGISVGVPNMGTDTEAEIKASGPGAWKGRLGDAVASEMRHKPSGSHLVVANSSETVIPAAGGFGMEAFAGYLTATAKNTAASANLLVVIRDVLNRVFPVMDNIKTMTSSSLTKSDNMIKTMTSGAMKVKFMLGGTGGKGGPGAVDAFNPIASSYGLQVTSGYRPGDPGYHGINRARDYSNGTSPTPQMMDFAQFMVGAFGGDLAELIYTPLGFSIKNGQITPPYAQAGHYNHVHVAYATGYPTLFGSEKARDNWEAKMAPKNQIIDSIRFRRDEVGGSNTIHAPITIYQQPNQDPEELASLVAMRLSMVIDELRNH